MPASPQPNASFLTNIISASHCPPAWIKTKLKTNHPSTSYNCVVPAQQCGWDISMQRPSPCKTEHPFPIPPSRGSPARRAAGSFHHLQDIRHRTMQSQWQRQKQCQIHSLLTIARPQPPACAPRMPGAPAPDQVSPGVINPLPQQHRGPSHFNI